MERPILSARVASQPFFRFRDLGRGAVAPDEGQRFPAKSTKSSTAAERSGAAMARH